MAPLSARLLRVMFVMAPFLLVAALMAGCEQPTPPSTPVPMPTPPPVVDDDVGLAGAAAAANEMERQLAQESGAGWDRLPMWWHAIHYTTTGELHPEVYDPILSNEPLTYVLAVLTGRSEYTGVVGLDLGCVAVVRAGVLNSDYWDGQYGFCVTYQGYVYDYASKRLISSEPPLVGGAPNPSNPWAMFVYQTSQHHSGRVSAWEIFNEHESGFSSGWDPACNCETPITYTYLPPPAVYAQMIRDAVAVLQATNPGEATVLGGAWQDDA